MKQQEYEHECLKKDCSLVWMDIYKFARCPECNSDNTVTHYPIIEQVDIIASGYEWVCPECDVLNLEVEWTKQATCFICGKTYETNLPEHALGK